MVGGTPNTNCIFKNPIKRLDRQHGITSVGRQKPQNAGMRLF